MRIIDIFKMCLSNSCAVVHVFCNVNQDGGQLQTTYREYSASSGFQPIESIDNLHHRLIFDLGKCRQKNEIPTKEPFKSSKILKFGRETL